MAYEYVDILAPTRGIRQDFPSTMLDPRAVPDARNVRFYEGTAVKRPGLLTLGTALSGTPRLVYTLRKLDGSMAFCAVTSTKFYSYTTDFNEEAVVLTNANNNPVYAMTTLDQMIFTDGVDAVKTWDGTGAPTDLGGAAGYGDSVHTAVSVASYANSTLLIAPTEGGVPMQQRVRRSSIGSATVWTGGTSGFNDLTSATGELLHAVALHPYLMIYGRGEIIVCRYTGGDSIFAFDLFSNQKCLSGGTVKDIGGAHIFLGVDNVYLVTASGVEPIGDGIKKGLFRILNLDEVHQAFALHLPYERLYMLFVPTSGATPDVCFEYNYSPNEGSWTVHDFTVSAGGSFYREATASGGETWDTIPDVGWKGQGMDRPWKSASLTAEHPISMFVLSDGQACELSDSVTDDQGAAVDAWLPTFDATSAEYQHLLPRWMGVEFEAAGDETLISYSVNEGVSWNYVRTVTLTGEWERYRVDFDASARKCRVRFQCNASGKAFKIRWARLKRLRGTNE